MSAQQTMTVVPADMWQPGYRAHRVTGTAMEPAIKNGSIVIVDPSREPEDGDVVVAQISPRGFGDLVIRFIRRDPAITETFLLATTQEQEDPIIVRPGDMTIEGTVVGVVTPAARIEWGGLKFPLRFKAVP